MVAEAIEATPEEVRSTSKAQEAAEGDVEAAGEAGQERPQDVHGAYPGHGRLTDTDNRIPFVQHVIEAHPEPVLDQYTLENLNHQTCSIILTPTKPDTSIKIPGNLKLKLITDATNVKNHIISPPNNLDTGIQVQGNLQHKIITGATEDKNNTKAKVMTSKNQPETTNKPKITSLVKNNMYPLRTTPLYVHEINSTSFMVNDLLKRAI